MKKYPLIIKRHYKGTLCIYENSQVVYNTTPLNLINEMCLKCGSTLEGNRQASKEILSGSHKLPVIVNQNLSLVYLPTQSMQNYDCEWIAYNYIKVEECKKGGTNLIYDDKVIYHTKTNYKILALQYFRAAELKKNIEKFKSKVDYDHTEVNLLKFEVCEKIEE